MIPHPSHGFPAHFRRDSAAYQAAVINHYSQPGRSFTITAALNRAVKRQIEHLPEAAWRPYRTAEGVATDREIVETVHTMNGSQQAFRLIVRRWPNPRGSVAPGWGVDRKGATQERESKRRAEVSAKGEHCLVEIAPHR